MGSVGSPAFAREVGEQDEEVEGVRETMSWNSKGESGFVRGTADSGKCS
jgi:hypothetical protein